MRRWQIEQYSRERSLYRRPVRRVGISGSRTLPCRRPIRWAASQVAMSTSAAWVGCGGPDPLTGRHPRPFAGFAAAAAHHLVAGVLGVGQDLIDQGEGPAVRAGRRVGVRVGGQPGADGGLAQMLADPPGVDAG